MFHVNICYAYVINNTLEWIEELTKKQFDGVLGFVPYMLWDKGWNTRNFKWTIKEISHLYWNLKKKTYRRWVTEQYLLLRANYSDE